VETLPVRGHQVSSGIVSTYASITSYGPVTERSCRNTGKPYPAILW
jgi:hypothetical protein